MAGFLRNGIILKDSTLRLRHIAQLARQNREEFMFRKQRSTRSAWGYLSAAALVSISATAAWAWKNPMENRYTTAPLDVCDQGAFFVGGVPKISNYVTSALAAGQP